MKRVRKKTTQHYTIRYSSRKEMKEKQKKYCRIHRESVGATGKTESYYFSDDTRATRSTANTKKKDFIYFFFLFRTEKNPIFSNQINFFIQKRQ